MFVWLFVCFFVVVAQVLSGRVAYSVPAPAATEPSPQAPDDGDDSDWNVCDEDFESEEEEEQKFWLHIPFCCFDVVI